MDSATTPAVGTVESATTLTIAPMHAAAPLKVGSDGSRTHAVQLLKNDDAFNCHTQQISSAGFASFFKTIWKMPNSEQDIPTEPKLGVVSAVQNTKPLAKLEAAGALVEVPKPIQECATQKFIYLKTHKTGSSTILSILHRYARCAFSDKTLHSRMPLDPTHVRLTLLHACAQWHSSREVHCSYRCHHKLCPNTEGL
jgi:hypothetical protein